MKYVKFLMMFSLLAVMVPNLVSAATVSDIQAQIQALLQQIKTLQEQLATMQQTTVAWCHDFNVNLGIGNAADSEVGALWAALEKEGFPVQAGKFDETTASAVTGFQQKYQDEILTPLGLKYGTGFVGKATRAKLNKLYGCGVTPPPFTCIQIACASNQKTVCPAGLNDKGCPLPCKCVPIMCGGIAGIICPDGYTCVYEGNYPDASGKCVSIPTTQNQPPVISGVSGPTTLKVSETGTWTVQASDPEQGVLSYSVRWGDENITGLYGAAQRNLSYVQTATFTHSYASDGTYNPTFTVTDNQGLLAKTSISVQVGEIITPSITVLSPNGGETWTSGTKQTIKWQDNRPIPTCTSPTTSGVSSTCIGNAPRLYDINLATYSWPCPVGMACVASFSPIYTVAKNIPINYYSWTVGAIQELYDALAPEGSYTIQVCQSGTNICDSSDAAFSIVAPSITVLSPNGGEVWQIGSTQTIRWSAQNVPQGAWLHLNIVSPSQGTNLVIADNIPVANGSYSWTVSSASPTLYSAADYKLEAKIYTGSSCALYPIMGGSCSGTVTLLASDQSNSTFSILVAVTGQ